MPKHIPELHDAAWLSAAYASKTTRKIAEELGCSNAGVIVALHRHGIVTRPSGRPAGPDQLQDRAWLLGRYEKYTTHEIAEQLGCAQITVFKACKTLRIPLRGRGKRYKGTGYKYVRQPNGQYKKAHRVIMEEHLGRQLHRWEHVHHIDGCRSNNDLSNLIVMTESEHHKLHGPDVKGWVQAHDYLRFEHICARCGKAFRGGNRAKHCPACR